MYSLRRSPVTRVGSGLIALAAVGVFVVGCSSDDSSTTPEPPVSDVVNAPADPEQSSTDAEDTAGSLDANTRDDLVVAAVAATQADRGEWAGDTMRLYYGSGSSSDVTADISCRAITHLLSDDDGLVLVYPDGEKDCRASR